jgi:CheY-like chemotaxis protein
MTVNYEWIYIRRLVEECHELLGGARVERDIELNYIIENDVPMWIKADKARLRQILLNIVGNALKFTDSGEVFTHCFVEKIPADKDNNAVMLKFEVHDTGRGFSEKDAAKMFRPYSQILENPKGTGLGLVISRQLAQLHGGDLTCEGKVGEGSIFTISCRVKLMIEGVDEPTRQDNARIWGSMINKLNNGEAVKINKQLKILVACPYKFSCKTIEHNIRSVVADPSQYQVIIVNQVDQLPGRISQEDGITHFVANLKDDDDVARALNVVKHKSIDIEAILLVSPKQRSTILKQISSYLDSLGKLTFLSKPLRPSRYGIIFDPSNEREESYDAKMSAARQTLERQRSIFNDLSIFAFNKGYKVLLAEDNIINQKVMIKFLAKVGIQCDVATDGLNCTKMFYDHGHDYYNLILCDLDMPRKDGFEVCEELRQWEKFYSLSPIPIVALSAYVMSDVRTRCAEVGFTTYISKPVDFNALKGK